MRAGRQMQFRFLGGFAAFDGDGPIPIAGQITRALAARLIVEAPNPATRESLCELFWPDSPPAAARLNLRQTLLRLRRALGGERADRLFIANRDAIHVHPEEVDLDYAECRHLLNLGAFTAVERAVAIYHGPLLEGEAPPTRQYDAWINDRRRALHDRLLSAGIGVLARYGKEGLTEQAERLAKRLTNLAPTDDDMVGRLIGHFASVGNVAQALDLFEGYRSAVEARNEEGLAPHIVELVEKITARGRPDHRGTGPRDLPPPDAMSRSLSGFSQALTPPQRKDRADAHLPRESAAARAVRAGGGTLDATTPVVTSALVISLRLAPKSGAGSPGDGDGAALAALVRIVERLSLGLGGRIDETKDGSVAVLFQGPIGLELTALRAAYVALKIRNELTRYAADLPGLDLTFAGAISVTDKDDTAGPAFGAARHALARARTLHHHVGSNEFLVCAKTRASIDPMFVCHEAGRMSLSSDPRGEPMFRLGPRRAESRHFDLRIERGLTPLAGRESELRFIEAKLGDVMAGDAMLVVLRGGMGQGKSRLVHEIEATARARGTQVVHLECTYLMQEVPFYPFRHWLENIMGLAGVEDGAERRRRALGFLEERRLKPEDFALIFDRVLGIALHDRPEHLNPHLGTMSELAILTRVLSGGKPFVYAVEDVEWIDPGTADYIALEHRSGPSTGKLVLLTIGGDNPLPHPFTEVNATIELGPLTRLQCNQIFDALDPDFTITEQDRARLITQSDGTPILLEALVERTLAEQMFAGARRTQAMTLPGRFEQAVRQYVGAAGADDTALHWAALLNMPFDAMLIADLTDMPLASVEEDLKRAVRANLLRQVQGSAGPAFDLSHSVVSNLLCAMMGPARIRRRCERIAAFAIASADQTARFGPERIARWYLRAGRPDRAVPHFLEAGLRALDEGASSHAVTLLEEAAGLSDRENLPAHRGEVLVALASARMRLNGAGSTEASAAWEAAANTAIGQHDVEIRARITWGRWALAIVRGELARADGLCKRLVIEASRSRKPNIMIEANHSSWTTAHLLGQTDLALDRVARGLEQMPVSAAAGVFHSFGSHHPGVCCRTVGAIVTCLSGDADRAKTLMTEAIGLAGTLGHSGSMAHALQGALDLAMMTDTPGAIQAYARQLNDLAQDENYFDFFGIGRIFAGWGRVAYDGEASGLVDIASHLAATRERSSIGLPLYTWMMADAEFRLGRTPEAAESLNAARAASTRTRESWWLPEILRLSSVVHGVLARQDGAGGEDAAQMLNEAEGIAHEQNARFHLARIRRTRRALPDPG